MAKKYFGTDGVRGEVGQFPITPDFVLKLGYAAGQVLVQHDTDQETDRFNRQGYAYFRLYAGSRFGGRFYGGGCECGTDRTAAHARRGLSDPCAAFVRLR